MKKSWYIIEKDYHRGPYSFEELKSQKAQGKLNDKSMLWQEGNTAALSFADACEIERKITETLIPDVPGVERSKLNEPPQFPGEVIFANEKFLKPTVKTASLDKINDNINENLIVNEVSKTPLNRVVGIYFASLLGLALFIGGALFYFYIGRTPILAFPTEMTQSDHERMKLVVDTRFVPENIFEISVAKDLSRLWLAVNFPFPSELQLEMNSIPEKTWQGRAVSVRAKATLENFLAEFKDFIVASDDGKFYPGFYKLKISLVETGDVNLMSKLIYRNKEFKEISVSEFFWGQGDKQEFLDLVAKSLPVPKSKTEEPAEEKESEDVQKLREKEEKVRTLISLVNLTDEETKNTFAVIEEQGLLKNLKELKKALNAYEKKYVKEVAPLLTSLGQEDDLQEAKILGKLFVEVLDTLRKQLKPKKKRLVLTTFAQNYLLKFKELEANLEHNLKIIEDDIVQQKTAEKAQVINQKTNQ